MTENYLNEKKLVYYFRIVYLLMLMMGNTNLTFRWDIFDILNYAVGFFGIALLVLRLIRVKSYMKTPGVVLLAVLLVLYAVSSVWNYSYGGFSGFVSNGKATIWMACQMCLLYAFDVPSREELKKEIGLICRIIVIFNFLSVLISYGMLLTNYSKFIMEGISPVMYGVVYDRLWGTFIDPNYGAVVAVIGVLLSAHFFRENRNIFVRVFHVINIALSIMYIIYSDSRTGMVVLALGIFCYAFLSLVYTTDKVQRKLVPMLISVALSAAISACVVGSFSVIKPIGLMPREFCMQIQSSLAEKMQIQQTQTTDPTGSTNKNDSTANVKEPLKIGRDAADINNDISNRRFDIWKSGMEILKKSPFLGTTFRNLVPFAQQEVPYTYIVHNDNKIFWDLHNVIMNVLVCQGIPALILFVAFAVIVLKKAFVFFLCKPATMLKEQVLLISILLGIAVASMFNTMIMYVSTIETAVFWMFLGYGMQICRLEETSNA